VVGISAQVVNLTLGATLVSDGGRVAVSSWRYVVPEKLAGSGSGTADSCGQEQMLLQI
jgi:hypothetical protein